MDKDKVIELYNDFKKIGLIQKTKYYPNRQDINWIMVLFIIYTDMGYRFLEEFIEKETNSCSADEEESYKMKMLTYNVILRSVMFEKGFSFIREFINIIKDYEKENII